MKLHVSALRHPHNPILTPQPNSYASRAVYNPAAWFAEERWWLLARCEAEGDPCRGRLGIATSADGYHFSLEETPVLVPEYPYEALGCEDPRVVWLEGQYVMTYVGNTPVYGGGHICLATSQDGMQWQKWGPVLHPQPGRWNDGQVKAGVIAPFKVRGRYLMFFLGERRPWHTAIGLAYSEDLLHWEEPTDNIVLAPRAGHFDSMGVEPGPPPVWTENGILLIYNGWDRHRVHCVGAALLDPEDPRRVVARTPSPFLRPTEAWEQRGQTPNVVFATGLVCRPSRWWLYYGAADRVVGLAQLSIEWNGQEIT